MIHFSFTGNPFPSHEEQQRATNFFIDKLGPFKQEFEKSGGFVLFDYTFPKTDNRRITYNVAPGYNISDFTIRWNEYIKKKKQNVRMDK